MEEGMGKTGRREGEDKNEGENEETTRGKRATGKAAPRKRGKAPATSKTKVQVEPSVGSANLSVNAHFWGKEVGGRERAGAGGWDLGFLGCSGGVGWPRRARAAEQLGNSVEKWREASRRKHTTITERKQTRTQ